MELILFLVLFCLYFAPTGYAFAKNHENWLGVLLVNLFFGWSVIGWIAAAIWATRKTSWRK